MVSHSERLWHRRATSKGKINNAKKDFVVVCTLCAIGIHTQQKGRFETCGGSPRIPYGVPAPDEEAPRIVDDDGSRHDQEAWNLYDAYI